MSSHNKSSNKQHRAVREDDMFRTRVEKSKKTKQPRTKENVDDALEEYQNESNEYLEDVCGFINY